jgi:catechol 2,3-dioxygenase-like lactoylglutathione lyase family enzyme
MPVSDGPAAKPARRFLHLCYCCDDAGSVTDLFVRELAMRNTMRTPTERSDGSLLGVDGEIVGCASFVHDQRGGRVSPAIEVHGWVEPALVGTPSLDPLEAGMKALGVAVPDVAGAGERLIAAGCRVVHEGGAPFAATWLVVADPRGVLLELVEDAGVPEGATRLRHLRITCTDLDVSLPFYDALGFSLVARGELTDAAFVGVSDPVEARFARLRLPDEPFEVILIQWIEPVSHGRHYAPANHAGLYRAALAVDDTRASFEAMREAGAVFDRPPRLVELRGTPVPDMWICFISDPDGVPFEFVQRPRSAFL